MATDSSVAGYLQPTAPHPVYGSLLDRVLHDVIKGATGITDNALVRPRWQPEPPPIPQYSVDWAAFGITQVQRDTLAHIQHASGAGTSDVLTRTELVTVLCSFYGPNASDNASRFEDCLEISQNRDALATAQTSLVSCGTYTNVPTQLHNIWVHRVDVPVTLRRLVQRTFPVLSLSETARGDLDNEEYVTPINPT